jgi:molecular chaperone DnaK
MSEFIVGIDLGTSSCSVALLVDGQPKVLPVFDGYDEFPTYVAFTPEGERLVGWRAKRQSVKNPSDTIFTVKRLIGRKYATKEIQAELGLLPYRVVPSSSGGLWVEAGGRSHTPTEITAIMLTEVRRATEAYLGHKVDKAVITVPAYFDESQRRATRDAAEIAGIRAISLIAEPTAAAIAQGYGQGGRSGVIAVYDLGGGTFDVAVLECGDGVYEVKAVAGDNRLGGEDFDHVLVRHFVSQIRDECGVDLSHDPMSLHRIKDASEQLKIHLDTAQQAKLDLPYLARKGGEFLNVQLKLTREELERLFTKLIEKTLVPCRNVIRDAGLSKKDLGAVVLVGGMSRMPVVQRCVEQFFGVPVLKHANPSKIVAQGAAIQAATLAGHLKDILLLDAIPMSLGIVNSKNEFVRFIDRNTTTPTKKSGDITRRENSDNSKNAPEVVPAGKLKIVQGDFVELADNLILAELPIDADNSPETKDDIFQVIFDVDAVARLVVEIKNLRTNKSQLHEIKAFDPFAPEQVLNASAEHLSTLRAQGDALLNTVDAAIDAHRNHIQPGILHSVGRAREGLQRAMQSRDAAELAGALAALSAAANMKPDPRPISPLPLPIATKAKSSDHSIFISYARADRNWLDRLLVHLKLLERDRKVEVWHDGEIEAGDQWRNEIDSAVRRASAAILLVSASFIASRFIYENELPPILNQHSVEGLWVFPVVISHCLYEQHPELSRLNAFNDPRKPLSSMSKARTDAELARLAKALWERLNPDR